MLRRNCAPSSRQSWVNYNKSDPRWTHVPAERTARALWRRHRGLVIFPRSDNGLATVNVTLFPDVPGWRPVRGKSARTGTQGQRLFVPIGRLGNPGTVNRRVLRAVRKLVVPEYKASQGL